MLTKSQFQTLWTSTRLRFYWMMGITSREISTAFRVDDDGVCNWKILLAIFGDDYCDWFLQNLGRWDAYSCNVLQSHCIFDFWFGYVFNSMHSILFLKKIVENILIKISHYFCCVEFQERNFKILVFYLFYFIASFRQCWKQNIDRIHMNLFISDKWQHETCDSQ